MMVERVDPGTRVAKMLEQVPIGAMVESMIVALTRAQHQLTMSTVEALVALADPKNGVDLFDTGDKVTLLELGLVPSFMHISEATITAKMAFSCAQSEELSASASASGGIGVVSASVNAGYSNKYSFNADGSSELTARIVTVPAPDVLKDLLLRKLGTPAPDETESTKPE